MHGHIKDFEKDGREEICLTILPRIFQTYLTLEPFYAKLLVLTISNFCSKELKFCEHTLRKLLDFHPTHWRPEQKKRRRKGEFTLPSAEALIFCLWTGMYNISSLRPPTCWPQIWELLSFHIAEKFIIRNCQFLKINHIYVYTHTHMYDCINTFPIGSVTLGNPD